MKNYLIYYVFITLSIFLNSCTEGFKEEYSKINIALKEVTAITTPTTDTTPDYTFSSTGSGAITYGDSCSSSTTIATIGNNTITLNTLSVGTYADCTITVSKTISNENSEKKLSGSLTITSFTIETSSTPLIAEVTAVTSPDNDTTPNYTFSSTTTGTITYGGSCTSVTTSANVDNNTITFSTLSSGNYSNCTIKVTDSAGNESNTLTITTFTVLPDGLIAYYPFDGNANAKIGTLNGTVSGATLSTGRNNESNTAYSFDGVDDYIEFGAGMLSGDGEFSILIWINTSSGSFARILSQRNGGYNGQYIVELESDGEIEFYTYSSLTGKWIVRSSSALNDGNWHHLAFVQQDNGGKMYLNGSLDQTDNSNGKVNLLSTNKTYLGKDGRNNSSFYTGKVDDLKIYNRALSASEIQTLFNTSD
jgi:hypothetical protein